MAHFEADPLTKIPVPAGAGPTTVPEVGRIKPKTSNDDVGVFAFCEDGHPLADTGVAIVPKIAGDQWCLQYAGVV